MEKKGNLSLGFPAFDRIELLIPKTHGFSKYGRDRSQLR